MSSFPVTHPAPEPIRTHLEDAIKNQHRHGGNGTRKNVPKALCMRFTKQLNASASGQCDQMVIADAASDVSRQAGVIGAAATAATAAASPQVKPITGSVAVGATVIGVAADAVEQMARPNTGQTVVNLVGAGLQEAANNNPVGKVVAPLTNEIVEAWKQTGASQSIQDWVNQR